MTIGDAESFLTSLQFADSFLPVGSFTMSYGLESFVQDDLVTDASDLADLLEDFLRYRIGRCDVVAVGAAHEATADGDLARVVEVDVSYHAMQLTKETRMSSTKSGRRFLELLTAIDPFDLLSAYRDTIDDGETHGHKPVVLGMATQHAGVGVREACFVYMYSFLSDLLGVAQRLLELGHTEVQSLLTELKPVVKEVWEANEHRDLAEMQAFTPHIDILGMQHERAELRLFRS